MQLASLASVTLVGIILSAGCAPKAHNPTRDAKAAQPADTPAEAIARRIDQVILLLEQGKRREVLETLAAPEDIKKAMAQIGSMEALLQAFDDKKAGALLQAMRASRGLTPEISDDGTTATVGEGSMGKSVRWVRVDGRWYFKN